MPKTESQVVESNNVDDLSEQELVELLAAELDEIAGGQSSMAILESRSLRARSRLRKSERTPWTKQELELY